MKVEGHILLLLSARAGGLGCTLDLLSMAVVALLGRRMMNGRACGSSCCCCSGEKSCADQMNHAFGVAALSDFDRLLLHEHVTAKRHANEESTVIHEEKA